MEGKLDANRRYHEMMYDFIDGAVSIMTELVFFVH